MAKQLVKIRVYPKDAHNIAVEARKRSKPNQRVIAADIVEEAFKKK